MPEAIETMRAPPDPRQAAAVANEPAIYELTGAGFAAAALLRAIATDDVPADSQSVRPALDWVARKLADAAENMTALHEGRAPRWRTLDAPQEIAAALANAEAAGAAHRSALGLSDD